MYVYGFKVVWCLLYYKMWYFRIFQGMSYRVEINLFLQVNCTFYYNILSESFYMFEWKLINTKNIWSYYCRLYCILSRVKAQWKSFCYEIRTLCVLQIIQLQILSVFLNIKGCFGTQALLLMDTFDLILPTSISKISQLNYFSKFIVRSCCIDLFK